MIFAEAVPVVPSPGDWHGFAIVALFVAFLGKEGVALVRFIRRDPEKREVTMALTHPTKEEFEELKGRVETIEATADEKRERFRLEVKQDIGELHSKINDVGREVSGVASSCEMINQNLALLRSEFARGR